MEGLGLIMFGDCYRGRRVLVTGHTGFKGSWLALWLQTLDAHVFGLALDPATTPSHWNLLRLDMADERGDIRNAATVSRTLQMAQPEIVFHLAAQPLVRRSYRDPLETWSTNVMGTANVLEACRQQPSVRAIIIVTTDKCYENHEWDWAYRENDRLGGHDPYSASKAAAELVVASYRKAFFNAPGAPLLASARAGNVIGGGDWSEDRLVPDLVRAVSSGKTLEIRSPHATRPWQHVLESLSGYMILGQRLLAGDDAFAQAWNFGSDTEDNQTVVQVLGRLQAAWPALTWHEGTQVQPHEATLLHLDSTLARKRLGWQSVWSLDESLAATADWYRAQHERGGLLSHTQLRTYVEDAARAGYGWAAV